MGPQPPLPDGRGSACEGASKTWRLSFWDGMIVAATEQNGASELWTEDLSHGQVIAGVTIVNPFVSR